MVLKDAENKTCTNTAGSEAYTVTCSSFCLGEKISCENYSRMVKKYAPDDQLGNSQGCCLGWNQVLSYFPS